MAAVLFFVLTISAEGQEREVLRHYAGPHTNAIPSELLHVYEELVLAIDTLDILEIKRHCLPGAVVISGIRRPNDAKNIGTEMNLGFLRSGFDKHISIMGPQTNDCFRIRTPTSGLSFVQTRSSGWKLYKYSDRPLK